MFQEIRLFKKYNKINILKKQNFGTVVDKAKGMWIENLINQINNNLTPLDVKRNYLSDTGFLELLNSIVTTGKCNELNSKISDIEEIDAKKISLDNSINVFLYCSNLLKDAGKKYIGVTEFSDSMFNFEDILQVFGNNVVANIVIKDANKLMTNKDKSNESHEEEKEIISLLQQLLSQNQDLANGFINKSMEKDCSNNKLGFYENIPKELQNVPLVKSNIGNESKSNLEKIDVKNFINFKNNNVEDNISNHVVFGKNPDSFIEKIKVEKLDRVINFDGDIIGESGNEISRPDLIKVESKKETLEYNSQNNERFHNEFLLVSKGNFETIENNKQLQQKLFDEIGEGRKIESIDIVLKERISIKKESSNTITLMMEPKELGRIKVSLTIHDGVIKAEVYPNTEQARNFFNENIDKIMASLVSEGISLSQFALKDNGKDNNKNNFENNNMFHENTPVKETEQCIKIKNKLNGLSIYA